MNQCYFNGDFYQCVAAAAAGESPASAPAKWRKISVPAKFRFALARLMYANLLEMDGQQDKAQEVKGEAYDMERKGLDDLARGEANQHRWLERVCVQLTQAGW